MLNHEATRCGCALSSAKAALESRVTLATLAQLLEAAVPLAWRASCQCTFHDPSRSPSPQESPRKSHSCPTNWPRQRHRTLQPQSRTCPSSSSIGAGACDSPKARQFEVQTPHSEADHRCSRHLSKARGTHSGMPVRRQWQRWRSRTSWCISSVRHSARRPQVWA